MYEYKPCYSDQIWFWDIKSDSESYDGSNSHYNKECEIIYMVSGECEMLIENQIFHLVSDSLLFMPANSFHQWKYQEGKINHRISINFMPEIFNDSEREILYSLFTRPFFLLNGSQHNLDFYVRAVTECVSMNSFLQKIALKSRVFSLVTQIYFLYSEKSVKPIILDNKIRKIITFIENNLQKDLTLDYISQKFFVSKNHINVLFKKAVGTTIKKFIMVKRLGFVREQLLRGSKPSEASYKAGFNDYTAFFRAYKAFYGTAPSNIISDRVNV